MRIREARSKARLQHYVYVSQLNGELLPHLADFLSQGITQGDLCIAILTPGHLRIINRMLQAKGIDMQTVIKSEQYLALNAVGILSVIDFGDRFDAAKYRREIETMSAMVAGDRPVRAFGEIVGRRVPSFGF